MTRLKIPLTGTVTGFDPECYKLDSVGISGDPNDPVRPVNVNLGGISWRLVNIDLETNLMEVEAEAPETMDVPVQDTNGQPVYVDGKLKLVNRATTPEEKEQILAMAQHILESHTVDELYVLTGDKRLFKPGMVMEKYLGAIAK